MLLVLAGAAGIARAGAIPELEGGRAEAATTRMLYIGTYTGDGAGKGIYSAVMDPDGRLSGLRLAVEEANPSFLALHPTGRFLYAVSEVDSFEGQPSGAVAAFEILPDGGLKLLGRASSGGRGPCHLEVDPGGSLLAVANYTGGSVSVLRIRDDGSISGPPSTVQHEGSSVNQRRQARPHAHCVNFDLFRPLLFAADLGIDQVRLYVPDPAGVQLRPADPEALELPPGSGPRHLDFSPDGRFVYVVNELNSTVSVFGGGADLSPRPLQTVSTLPPGADSGNSTAEIEVAPDGRTVYVSNRGHDSIAVLRVSAPDGTLELVQNAPVGGRNPRHFTLDPSGRFLLAAAQGSDQLTVLAVDPESGRLAATGHSLSVPRPVCILFPPAQR